MLYTLRHTVHKVAILHKPFVSTDLNEKYSHKADERYGRYALSHLHIPNSLTRLLTARLSFSPTAAEQASLLGSAALPNRCLWNPLDA